MYSIRRQLTNEEREKLGGISSMKAHLLFHRGIRDLEEADKFLAPEYESGLHDPSLLKDADRAAARIIQAIKNGEKVVIYADYDADGIPGAAIWHDFFRRIGFKNFSVYIPHRHDEGFGLNVEAIEQLANEGTKLVVTVDCGIADGLPVEKANGLGIDVIITDHHEPPVELPKAFAIVDHKQADCNYPDKNICGAGVAYKLIQAVLKIDRFGLKEGMEKWLLDLVGLATLSDMVLLTGENRIFAYYGLQVLRKSPRKGLRRLLDTLKISRNHITEDDIAFMITPRINAASRMGVPMDAFHLLVADNDESALKYASKLDRVNNERKTAVALLVKEVKKTLKARYGITSAITSADSMPAVIVLGNPAWRPSLLGLAANSCAEEFNRPVFLWGRDGGNEFKGSCRSEGRTHVVELMRAVPAGVFTQFGGHKHSGGFTISKEQIHYVDKHLNDACQVGAIDDEDVPEIIDGQLDLDAVDWRLYGEIAGLAPFGAGNHKPVFIFKNIVPILIRRFGKAKEHVGLDFKKSNGEKISAISFFGAENEWSNSLETGKAIDLVASLEKSVFRGQTELRLRIADIIKKL